MSNYTIPSYAALGRSETDCMNALQNHGVISDEAVWWQDVANQQEALSWLANHPNEL